MAVLGSAWTIILGVLLVVVRREFYDVLAHSGNQQMSLPSLLWVPTTRLSPEEK